MTVSFSFKQLIVFLCLVLPEYLSSVSDTCQKNFVTQLLRHSAPQTWLYMLQLYLVKQATIWGRAEHEMSAKS